MVFTAVGYLSDNYLGTSTALDFSVLGMIVMRVFNLMSNWVLVAIPMFIYMGMMLDDQALFVRTSQGLLVLSGCAHRGIINTLLHARELTGEDRIHMVVGGTHLLNTGMHQQERTADWLQQLGVHRLGVSHCTGLKPACYLAQRLGLERFFFNRAGTAIGFHNREVKVGAFER